MLKNKRLIYVWGILIVTLVTLVFSVSWIRSVPFTKAYPVLDDLDAVGYYGRFLIYSREPIHFPLGKIDGLTFPYQISPLSRGGIPLFAFVFKVLGKAYPSLSIFFYFPLVEIVSVAITASLTFALLYKLGIRSAAIMTLGVVTLSLSFPLLYRSSEYSGLLTFQLIHVPVYFLWTYGFWQFRGKASYKNAWFIWFLLPTAFMLDFYLVFSLIVINGVALSLLIIKYYMSRLRSIWRSIKIMLFSGFCAMIVGAGAMSQFGRLTHLPQPTRHSVVYGRFRREPIYGGGKGGVIM